MDFRIRRLNALDSLEALTSLLHHAYASHAAAGRVFFASYQSAEDTRHRISKGECWLAHDGHRLAGTVTVVAPGVFPAGYPAPPGAGTFYQLAVLPEVRHRGLGGRLLTLAEERIASLGARTIAIDTSALATDLIDWYIRRGYSRAGVWQWKVTNYESLVLTRSLG